MGIQFAEDLDCITLAPFGSPACSFFFFFSWGKPPLFWSHRSGLSIFHADRQGPCSGWTPSVPRKGHATLAWRLEHENGPAGGAFRSAGCSAIVDTARVARTRGRQRDAAVETGDPSQWYATGGGRRGWSHHFIQQHKRLPPYAGGRVRQHVRASNLGPGKTSY
jgi:hypothetical protein